MSQLYVGSISDIELTRVSGYLQTLHGKGGVSVMADRGFMVRDMLAENGVDLNIPPFMEGREQLPADEVKRGRSIASLRIHVERAIGRIKNYAILKGTLPITMIRIANQIVCVCAWLTNFQPALVPLPSDSSMEDEVDSYFQSIEDSDCDADSEESDGRVLKLIVNTLLCHVLHKNYFMFFTGRPSTCTGQTISGPRQLS